LTDALYRTKLLRDKPSNERYNTALRYVEKAEQEGNDVDEYKKELSELQKK